MPIYKLCDIFNQHTKMRNSISESREINKLGLETFFLSIENNSYDSGITKTIDFYEKKINQIRETQNITKNQEEEINDEWGIIFLEQELRAITEMKIIYAYKNFEIKLKFLIGTSYQKTDKSKMYDWRFITDFLRTRKIDIKNIKSYSDIDELRNVNNSIKHSDILESRVLPKEFKNKKSIDYKDILAFYNRIENSPKEFITSLSNLILKDLYDFDENRINEIAESIALRLDKNSAEILVQKILEKY